MLTSALYASCRYRLTEETYSTYQIVDALNYVMREINLALNSVTSSLTTETATLTPVAGVADLPADFESMISVGSLVSIPTDRTLDSYAYQIIGNTIQVEGTTVDIYYRKSFEEYTWDGAVITPMTIDLPSSFNNMIIDSVVGRTMGQSVSIQSQALRLISIRDGKKRDRIPVFTM